LTEWAFWLVNVAYLDLRTAPPPFFFSLIRCSIPLRTHNVPLVLKCWRVFPFPALSSFLFALGVWSFFYSGPSLFYFFSRPFAFRPPPSLHRPPFDMDSLFFSCLHFVFFFRRFLVDVIIGYLSLVVPPFLRFWLLHPRHPPSPRPTVPPDIFLAKVPYVTKGPFPTFASFRPLGHHPFFSCHCDPPQPCLPVLFCLSRVHLPHFAGWTTPASRLVFIDGRLSSSYVVTGFFSSATPSPPCAI